MLRVIFLLSRLKSLFLLFFLLLLSRQSFAHTKVIMQLRWLHQFQFAGYYVALLIEKYPEYHELLALLTHKYESKHEAQHAMVDCLNAMIWQAQRNKTAPLTIRRVIDTKIYFPIRLPA